MAVSWTAGIIHSSCSLERGRTVGSWNRAPCPCSPRRDASCSERSSSQCLHITLTPWGHCLYPCKELSHTEDWSTGWVCWTTPSRWSPPSTRDSSCSSTRAALKSTTCHNTQTNQNTTRHVRDKRLTDLHNWLHSRMESSGFGFQTEGV